MIRVIPAIDVIEGKCVRLEEGRFERTKVYRERPLDVAQRFADAGVTHLHLVDLDGTLQKRVVNHKVLEVIANRTDLIIDFGGGIASDEDARIVFESGADLINVGSIAVKNPELFRSWLSQYGADKVILSADARDEKIAISGWEEATSLDIFQFLRDNFAAGVTQATCTDISKDGMLQGPAFELYSKIKQELPELRLTASGGVHSIDDLWQLDQREIDAVIIGKALYEGTIKLVELAPFLEPALE